MSHKLLLSLTVCLCVVIVNPLHAQTASTGCWNFNFDQDGVLPSAAGMAYVGSVPEASAFLVQSGLLQMSSGFGGWALYQAQNAYNPEGEAILEFRMKLYPPTFGYGVEFAFSQPPLDYEFGFDTDRIYLPFGPSGYTTFAFQPGNVFHTYKIMVPAGAASYELFIDGALAVSGTVTGGDDTYGRFLFGDGTGGGDGRADFDFIRFCNFRTVQIDIRPGADNNIISLNSAGVVPVAILSTPDFNAPAKIDPASITLAGARVRMVGRTNRFLCNPEDVNHDGIADLVCRIETAQFIIEPGDAIAVLEARTFAGLAVRGEDAIRVVPD